MMMPMKMMSPHICPSITRSVSLRGLRAITSSVEGSTPIAKAGAASVSRLIHSSCVASSGTVTPWLPGCVMPRKPASITPPKTVKTSPTLELSRYRRNLRMLSKMPRPSRTASTMVLKLSSARIILALCLVTSVPVMPIATPMSAVLTAGASFTPSPVMATILPCRCSDSTIFSLCSGATRAYTEIALVTLSNDASSGSSSSWLPVSTLPDRSV